LGKLGAGAVYVPIDTHSEAASATGAAPDVNLKPHILPA